MNSTKAASADPIGEAARDIFLWYMLRGVRGKLRTINGTESGTAPRAITKTAPNGKPTR